MQSCRGKLKPARENVSGRRAGECPGWDGTPLGDDVRSRTNAARFSVGHVCGECVGGILHRAGHGASTSASDGRVAAIPRRRTNGRVHDIFGLQRAVVVADPVGEDRVGICIYDRFSRALPGGVCRRMGAGRPVCLTHFGLRPDAFAGIFRHGISSWDRRNRAARPSDLCSDKSDPG